MAELFYLGHASLRLMANNGKYVYVDPFAGDNYDKPADIVLITHEHYDHNDIQKINQKENTVIIRAKDALIDGTYYDFEYYGIKIHATPACNKNHPIDQCVGFLIEMDGLKIYVAGDTDYVPYMDELGTMDIDYAFLPIDGVYNMGPQEATRCANIIKPKHLIPYHMKPGVLFDIKQDMMVTYEKSMLVRPNDKIVL